MENIKEFYFWGQPITTELGDIHFIKVKDYTKLYKYIPYLNLEKFEVTRILEGLDSEVATLFKDMPYIHIIRQLSSILDVYQMLKELFVLCFKDNVLDKIDTDDDFDTYCQLIRDMNCIHKEKKNPNPEIERFNQMKKMYSKKKSGGEISLESMVSSVYLELGNDVFELTIYQLYALFNRLNQFRNYDTTVLYNSVAGNVPIEMWFKHVDIMSDKEEILAIDDFTEYAKKLMVT